MTLAGGDFRSLTLEEFLGCGYTLLVDEMLRLGERMDVMTAQEQLGLLPKPTPIPPAPPSEEVVARQNAEAMRELQERMKGLKR